MDEKNNGATGAAEDEEIDFVQIAGIVLNGRYYAIMQPAELLEGMDEDEALIFDATEAKNGGEVELVDDDDIIDAVFAEYYRLVEQEKGN